MWGSWSGVVCATASAFTDLGEASSRMVLPQAQQTAPFPGNLHRFHPVCVVCPYNHFYILQMVGVLQMTLPRLYTLFSEVNLERT